MSEHHCHECDFCGASCENRGVIVCEGCDPVGNSSDQTNSLRDENNELKARIAELEAQLEWKDIKDAPRDGSSIITIVQGHQPCVTEWVQLNDKARFCTDPETFMEQEHFEEYFFQCDYEPTHWMPLIPGPSTQEGGKE